MDTTVPGTDWPAAAASRRRRRFAPPLVSALSQDPYRDGRDPAFCTVTGFDRRRLLAVPCISTLLTLRLLSDSGRPPLGCYPIWPPPVTMTRTRDGRSLSRDAPPFLMMTADSSRSPRLLLLLTVRRMTAAFSHDDCRQQPQPPSTASPADSAMTAFSVEYGSVLRSFRRHHGYLTRRPRPVRSEKNLKADGFSNN